MSGLHKTFYRYTTFLKTPWLDRPERFEPSESLLKAWQGDGIRLRALSLAPPPEARRVQLVCETEATVPPVHAAQRLKGRLNHDLRGAFPAFPGFERDFLLGTLGQNDRGVVERYIREQVDRSDLVDPLYRKRMKALRFHEEPSAPVRGKHRGVHDHFLHIVLVTGGRYRMFVPEAKRVAASLLEGGAEAGMEVLELSIMPDHAHAMVRPDHHRSPERALEDLKRESGRVLRRTAFWQNGGYTGTVGPYRMDLAIDRTRRAGGWVDSGFR